MIRRLRLGCVKHRSWMVLSACSSALLLLGLTMLGGPLADAAPEHDFDESSQIEVRGDTDSRIRIGYEITPVKLDLQGKNPALVGLGSYIVNAQVGCSDCHTWPQFLPGGNPFLGQTEQTNTAGYLGGGRVFTTPFGLFVSDNITPDPATGLPAGLTLDEFMLVMRSGVDHDGGLLQVMPWPWYRYLTDRDLEAIYEYLSAVPSVP